MHDADPISLNRSIAVPFLIYLNTWHLGVPKFSFKRVRVLEIHPTQPRGGHPSHSNLVRGKLTSPTPNPAGDGTSGLTSYPRRRSKVSEATCLRPQRSAPSRTWTLYIFSIICSKNPSSCMLPSFTHIYQFFRTKIHSHSHSIISWAYNVCN